MPWTLSTNLRGPTGPAGAAGATGAAGPAGLTSVENYSASLAADVAMPTSNAWVNGPSVTLPIGTWLVTAHLTHLRTAALAETVFGRVSDGTTHYASAMAYNAAVINTGVALAMTAVVVRATAGTVRLQATTSAGAAASLMKAALTPNGVGNNATSITAIRLA
jgi:hypothetical protein